MADDEHPLDVAIRARLADPKSFMENGVEPLIDALITVLNFHKRYEDGSCLPCLDWNGYDDGSLETWWAEYPCTTIQKIAQALGVEVSDA